jgi:sarcosine oxidase subunit alpha
VVPEASQIITPGGEILGRITSSRMSPTLGRSICLGQVHATLAKPGTELTVRLPDGRDVTARVTEHLAHVDPEGKRQQVASRVSGLRPYAMPVARSPIAPGDRISTIADWEVDARHSRAPLTISDHTPLAKIGVRGPEKGGIATALGTRFGRAARDISGSLVVGSGPGEWLVLGDPGSQDKLLPQTRHLADETGEFASVIDLTHGRAMIRLTGEDCAGLLAKVSGIDQSDGVIPDGAALRTSVANLVTDVVRVDHNHLPSYLLHCERSSGQYLFDSLLDAGREFGIEIDGCPVSLAL